MPRPLHVRPAVGTGAALLLALAALPAAGRAQDDDPAPLRLGLFGGRHSSTLRIDDPRRDADPRTGFVGGGYVIYGFAPAVAVRTELVYAMKGATRPAAGRVPASVVKLDYVEVPVLLHLEPLRRGALRPRVYAGPAFAVRARCRLTSRGTRGEVTTNCSGGADRPASPFFTGDLSGVVGGEVAVARLAPALAVGVRYTHGFSNVSTAPGGTIRNRALGVYGAVEFPLGG